jgi:hypothetical protein
MIRLDTLRWAALPLLVACSSPFAPAGPASTDDPSGDLSGDPSGAAATLVGDPHALPGATPDVSTSTVGEVSLEPDHGETVTDPGGEVTASRDVRRMDYLQLRASMERVFQRTWRSTDAQWTVAYTTQCKPGDDKFWCLAASLGQPNYYETGKWNNDVTTLFEKLLGDAARDLCSDAIDAEDPAFFQYAGPADSVRAEPLAARANVRHNLLRFHGKWLDETVEADAAKLDIWVDLVDRVTERTGSSRQGWKALCVALVTHPDFATY